jgi:4,5-DOPA dioxygenase extradiol
MTRLPAVFLGHGNPMNTLEHNRSTDAWRAFGATVERPRAVLAVSAHWYVPATAVTAMAHPATIHDFAGFPPELFAVSYPAPGDPALAAEVADLLAPAEVQLDTTEWGLDHGTWSVLAHVFPEADIPVVQLSIDARRPFEHHVAVGAALHALRERGVLVVASGNVVHNLGLIAWGRPGAGFDWAERFDDATRAVMTTDPASIGDLQQHPDFARAVPTPDHFLPLCYLAGLADAAGEPAHVLVDGYDLGSLSMTAYILDGDPTA